jgi:FixJ family two-component response regulator
MEGKPIVYVVDDDSAVRDALDSLIRSAGLDVQTFASASDFLHGKRPDVTGCLVLDVQLPGLSGLDLQHALTLAGAHLPIIFITGHGDIPMSVRAMKAGAAEFLTKPFTERDLLNAIRQAIESNRAFQQERAQKAELRERFQSLTPREHEVMKYVVDGLLNKQIAFTLGTSMVTVKLHRRHVMEKMRAGSVAELSRMAKALEIT